MDLKELNVESLSPKAIERLAPIMKAVGVFYVFGTLTALIIMILEGQSDIHIINASLISALGLHWAYKRRGHADGSGLVYFWRLAWKGTAWWVGMLVALTIIMLLVTEPEIEPVEVEPAKAEVVG